MIHCPGVRGGTFPPRYEEISAHPLSILGSVGREDRGTVGC